ncbi:hypothetical protein AABM17_761 [Neisseria musculi]|uniref:Uncharacterized protein n=1 Tax=Neisseria musculi TaxID=1815583 RepID=A0A7H1M7Z4_9NEIS|nr:hypothetical protein H7A79_0761 [Neisseria musculi]
MGHSTMMRILLSLMGLHLSALLHRLRAVLL